MEGSSMTLGLALSGFVSVVSDRLMGGGRESVPGVGGKHV